MTVLSELLGGLRRRYRLFPHHIGDGTVAFLVTARLFCAMAKSRIRTLPKRGRVRIRPFALLFPDCPPGLRAADHRSLSARRGGGAASGRGSSKSSKAHSSVARRRISTSRLGSSWPFS